MRLTVSDLSSDGRYVWEVAAAWRMELAYFRAASAGYNQRPLEPGECAQADAQVPTSLSHFIRLYRLLEAAGTEFATSPRLAMREFMVNPTRTELKIASIDHTFDLIAWHATIGPNGSGMIEPYGRSGFHTSYEPFALRLVACDLRCPGMAAAPGTYYIREYVGRAAR
jgi:hypothetical protein